MRKDAQICLRLTKLQKEKITRLKDTDYEKYQKLWSMKNDMFKKMYLSENNIL